LKTNHLATLRPTQIYPRPPLLAGSSIWIADMFAIEVKSVERADFLTNATGSSDREQFIKSFRWKKYGLSDVFAQF
jgi:hypothetical protein